VVHEVLLQLAGRDGPKITELTSEFVLAAVVVVEDVVVEELGLGVVVGRDHLAAAAEAAGHRGRGLTRIGLDQMVLEMEKAGGLEAAHRAHGLSLLQVLLPLVHRDVSL